MGDPTLGGWLAVWSYGVAGMLCAVTWWRMRQGWLAAESQEAGGYLVLAVSLLLLGVNKQLDLQSAFTEIGRLMAHQQGWYDQRHRIQLAFMTFLGVLALTVLAIVIMQARRWPVPTRLAWAAWLALGVFVLLRASSFHHMDRFIGMRMGGVAWNHWLELGSLWVLVAAVGWRLRQT